jgi:hypothetical protein
MPRTKRKICLGCGQPFAGRSDARTCSAKCRKRFQRAKIVYRGLLHDEQQPKLAYGSLDYGPASYRLGETNYRKGDHAGR